MNWLYTGPASSNLPVRRQSRSHCMLPYDSPENIPVGPPVMSGPISGAMLDLNFEGALEVNDALGFATGSGEPPRSALALQGGAEGMGMGSGVNAIPPEKFIRFILASGGGSFLRAYEKIIGAAQAELIVQTVNEWKLIRVFNNDFQNKHTLFLAPNEAGVLQGWPVGPGSEFPVVMTPQQFLFGRASGDGTPIRVAEFVI